MFSRSLAPCCHPQRPVLGSWLAAAFLLMGMSPWQRIRTNSKPAPAPQVRAAPAPGGLSAPPTTAPPTAGPHTITSSPSNSLRPTSRKRPWRWGGQLDLGFPDGVTAGLTLQAPVPLRLNAAVAHNTISPGVRIGLDWLPLGQTWVVCLQAGHYFEGNASHWASRPNSADSIVLERVSYNFFNLRTGVELSGEHFSYFATVGLSYLRAPIRQVERLLDPSDTGNGTLSLRVPEDPTLSVWMPSLQLGIRISP